MPDTLKPKKERKKPVPRNSASIFAGALKMPLAEMVSLKKQLEEKIKEVVDEKNREAKEATELANGNMK